MTSRRTFIRQAVAAGVAGSVTSLLFAKEPQAYSEGIYLSANQALQLYIGWGEADITPSRPVALTGQLHKRISESVQDRLAATVLALETIGDDGQKEQAVMVSCDLLFIRGNTQKKLQDAVAALVPDLDVSKIFLNATHTHTGPGLIDDEFLGLYDTSNNPGVMKPSEYEAFFVRQTSLAIAGAWKNRQPGGYSWALGNAVLGHNRRTVRKDGTARMYGVNDPSFDHYEGPNDNRVQILTFWDLQDNLSGILLNTVATAQVTDGTSFISADFYHEVRQSIRSKYGSHLPVFVQVGAAGDITPANHEFVYKRAEAEMIRRKGITARQELANRLLRAVEEVLPFMKNHVERKVILKHQVALVNLPVKDPPAPPFYLTDSVSPAEIHVLRLGDVAIATNPFELFIDYGIMIKARSKAILTFIVQLSCHHSGYLPSKRAEEGGGYSADNYLVGHQGGNKLVEETVRMINSMWE